MSDVGTHGICHSRQPGKLHKATTLHCATLHHHTLYSTPLCTPIHHYQEEEKVVKLGTKSQFLDPPTAGRNLNT